MKRNHPEYVSQNNDSSNALNHLSSNLDFSQFSLLSNGLANASQLSNGNSNGTSNGNVDKSTNQTSNGINGSNDASNNSNNISSNNRSGSSGRGSSGRSNSPKLDNMPTLLNSASFFNQNNSTGNSNNQKHQNAKVSENNVNDKPTQQAANSLASMLNSWRNIDASGEIDEATQNLLLQQALANSNGDSQATVQAQVQAQANAQAHLDLQREQLNQPTSNSQENSNSSNTPENNISTSPQTGLSNSTNSNSNSNSDPNGDSNERSPRVSHKNNNLPRLLAQQLEKQANTSPPSDDFGYNVSPESDTRVLGNEPLMKRQKTTLNGVSEGYNGMNGVDMLIDALKGEKANE